MCRGYVECANGFRGKRKRLRSALTAPSGCFDAYALIHRGGFTIAVPTEIPAVPTEMPAVPTEMPAVPTEMPAVPTEMPNVRRHVACCSGFLGDGQVASRRFGRYITSPGHAPGCPTRPIRSRPAHRNARHAADMVSAETGFAGRGSRRKAFQLLRRDE
jgi:hypothetical protein